MSETYNALAIPGVDYSAPAGMEDYCPHGRHSDEDCPLCFRQFVQERRGLKLVHAAVDEVLGTPNGEQKR